MKYVICPPGYRCLHKPRACGRGGGVGVVYNAGFDEKLSDATGCFGFEFMVLF